MGDNSKIEWTDASWNTIVGCDRCSAGCDNCYAILTVARGERMGTPQHAGLTLVNDAGRPDWNGKINYVEHLLDQPLRWGRPRRIFVNSLSDVFHPEVSKSYIAKMFAIMALADHHVFQLLTKRPQRMRNMLNHPRWAADVYDAATELAAGSKVVAKAFADSLWPATDATRPLILPNVWLGVSIEDNAAAYRAKHLLATPAAVRWVSAEPLIGPLDQLDLTGIDWMVAGGESGPGARPMHPAWVTDLRDRCLGHQSVTAGPTVHRTPVAFHFKQWGDWAVLDPTDHRATHVVEPDGYGHPRLGEGLDAIARRGAVHVGRLGKKNTDGTHRRELDGRTWDEWPVGHEVLVG